MLLGTCSRHQRTLLEEGVVRGPLLEEGHGDASYNSDAQRAPPERACMHVAISIWAQTPAGVIQTATCILAPLQTARRPPEWETFQTPAEIDCLNRPATENGCSEETFCGKAMLIFGSLKVHIINLKFVQQHLKIRLR